MAHLSPRTVAPARLKHTRLAPRGPEAGPRQLFPIMVLAEAVSAVWDRAAPHGRLLPPDGVQPTWRPPRGFCLNGGQSSLPVTSSQAHPRYGPGARHSQQNSAPTALRQWMDRRMGG